MHKQAQNWSGVQYPLKLILGYSKQLDRQARCLFWSFFTNQILLLYVIKMWYLSTNITQLWNWCLKSLDDTLMIWVDNLSPTLLMSNGDTYVSAKFDVVCQQTNLLLNCELIIVNLMTTFLGLTIWVLHCLMSYGDTYVSSKFDVVCQQTNLLLNCELIICEFDNNHSTGFDNLSPTFLMSYGDTFVSTKFDVVCQQTKLWLNCELELKICKVDDNLGTGVDNLQFCIIWCLMVTLKCHLF